jgi:ElaB/YqjD/DUF883 family membrane-anchored ribosome-binding protein
MHGESEADVLHRIEETRERMGDTISRIGDRVNPDRVKRELKETIKGKARDTMRGIEHEAKDTGRGIWHTIKENPIPAGMVGIGLAWLIANKGDHEEHRTRFEGRPHGDPAFGYPTGGRAVPYPPEHYGQSAGGAAREGESVRERAGEAAENIRESADDAMDAVRDKASHVADRASDAFHDAQDRVEDMAHQAGHRARRVERRVEHMVEDNPLAAGMVAAALGFAAGLVIPETQREHEVMGHTRDKLIDRARHVVHEAKDTARDVARETAGATAKKAVDEAMGGGDSRHADPMTGPGR